MSAWREKLSPYLMGSVCLAYAGLFFDLMFSNIALFILIGLCVAVFNYKNFVSTIKSSNTIQLVIVFYLLHIVGLLGSENMDNGLFVLEKKVTLLVMPLFVFPGLQQLTQKQRTELVLWLGLITMASSVLFLTNSILKVALCHDPMAFYHEDFASIPYVFYSIYFAIGSLLLLHFAYQHLPHSPGKIFLLLLLIFYSLTLLVIISSKTGILAYVIGLAYLLYKNILSKRIFFACVAGVVISLSVLLLLNPRTLNRFTELTKNINLVQADSVSKTEVFTGLNLRIFFWKASVTQLWNENQLITGIGTGDSQDFLNTAYASVNLDYFGYQGFDAHNQWVMTILQLGLIGVGMLAGIFIVGWRAAGKTQNWNWQFFMWIIFCFSLSESVLESNKGIVFVALFLCVLTQPVPGKKKIN